MTSNGNLFTRRQTQPALSSSYPIALEGYYSKRQAITVRHIQPHHETNTPTQALLLAKTRSKDIATITRGIVFLGVPHRGTNAAYFAACLSCTAFFRGSSSSLLQFMAVDSPGLLELETDFYDSYVLQDRSRRPQPYICDVLETHPERMGKLALGWVWFPPPLALINGCNSFRVCSLTQLCIQQIVRPKHGLLRHGRVFTLDTDHRGLNKFYSQDDPNFQVFISIMSHVVSHALDTGTRSRLPKPT